MVGESPVALEPQWVERTVSQDRLAEAHGAPEDPETWTPEGHPEAQTAWWPPWI